MTDDLQAQLKPLLDAQQAAHEAELKRIDLEQRRLKEAQKAALSEQRRERFVEALLGEVGQVIRKMDHLILANQYLSTEINELSEAFQAKLDQAQYVLSLLVEITRLRVQGNDPGRLSELLREADRVELDFVETEELALRKRIRALHKTLNELKNREAMYGISAPVELINEIDYTEQRIERAEQELQALQAARQE